jgi:hypothetical protein
MKPFKLPSAKIFEEKFIENKTPSPIALMSLGAGCCPADNQKTDQDKIELETQVFDGLIKELLKEYPEHLHSSIYELVMKEIVNPSAPKEEPEQESLHQTILKSVFPSLG